MKKIINRRLLFRIHSWAGIKLSILFFIVCFSGTIAVFSSELDWLFNPATRAESSEQTASFNEAYNNIKNKYPDGVITFWQRAREPYLADIVHVNLEEGFKYVFVNPYTAEVQGDADITLQRFFRDLHYFLFIPWQVGHYTVLVFGFLLFASLITSMFIYKNWYKKLFILRIGKGKGVFYSSLHKLIGAWSIPFMFLISLTSIWYFIERADFPKVSHYLRVEIPKVDTTGIILPVTINDYVIDYDKCVQLAESAIPNLKVKTILPPGKIDSPVYLTGVSDVSLVRNRANRVYIDPYRYDALKVQKAENINTVTWINDIADPLHFGYWGGWITKIIWFIFGMTITMLTITGPWIYWKRTAYIKKRLQGKKI